MNARKLARRIGAIVLVLVLTLAALVAWLNVQGEATLQAGGPTAPASSEAIARGAYLARAGNCMGCHTTTGGAEFAGGRGVETPFGIVVAPNITPDVRTGIGTWSASDFWRSLHHGRSKDGRLLYPAFPYPNRQPFGMPPYGQVLNDNEIAAVATFIRQSWGNSASPVSALDVLRVK